MHAALWLALCLMPAADPAQDPNASIKPPTAVDKRLTVQLFAAEPDIVTPCGLAVDARGRVLVVESHTHFRPTNYQGPPADRIRMLVDTDGDGRADKITNFYAGTTYTMNIAVHPDGSIYVASRNEIFRLRDTNDDGTADERTTIARLETKGNYPHNGLSGFAFDFDGNVFFGLGENLGVEFKLIGTDNSVISDLEGGQIYRCRADGSQVELVAFGFWNPFHLTFDAFGRLFAVDNDPDSLPPCRLLHIVPGGNYGYRYRNGRRGVHPFTAWNGELPGTLPMVAGTGEAPSGVVAYESDKLPGDYIGDLLVTSWGDHRIERCRTEPRGASFRSTPVAILQGDENFRPVGIAVAPDGAVFISDWVLKDYDLHGKGRVWRISSKEVPALPRPTKPAEAVHSPDRAVREDAARKLASTVEGRAKLAELAADDASPRVRALALMALPEAERRPAIDKIMSHERSADVRALAVRLAAGGPFWPELLTATDRPEERAAALGACDASQAGILWQAVTDSDAFIAQAARAALARTGQVGADFDFTGLSPDQRLACALILRESRDPQAEQALPKLLRDPDARVRFAAIQWIGEERLTAFGDSLEEALKAGPATARLFGGYLAALERLDGVKRQPWEEWGGEQYIVRALEDPQTSPEVRRFALGMLRPDHPLLTAERLRQYLDSGDAALQLEAVRTLRDVPLAERQALLAQIAGDEKHSDDLRAEAIVGIVPETEDACGLLVGLARKQGAIRSEALRSLRGAKLSDSQQSELRQLAAGGAGVQEMVSRILDPPTASASETATDAVHWLKQLRGADGKITGDAKAGARIFFHQKSAACARCHQVAGRGARVGPELTATTGTLSEERLIESIVRPSSEIAPRFVPWQVITTDGRSLTGVLVHEEATGEQTYADAEGKLTRLKPAEIELRHASQTSIMPADLPRLMTLQEFRDLIAFLRSQ